MQRQPLSDRRHLHAVRRNRRPPRRPWRAAFFVVLAGAVLIGAGQVYRRGGPGEIPQTVPVRHGTVEVSVDTDVLIVRAERVYQAPAAGPVERLAKEGERVRAGTPVVRLSGAGEVSAAASGLVFYQLDGLEGLLDPAESGRWEPGWFKGLPVPEPRPASEGRVGQGQPLFKVVDNFGQALLAMVNMETLPLVDEGAQVAIRFPGRGGAVAEGKVARLWRDGHGALVYLTAPLFPQGLDGVRKARVTLVFDSITGTVVPRSAIDVRGGRQGVWVLEGTRPVFLPGKVVGGNAAEVVLEAPLLPGARVVRIAPTDMD